MIFAFHFVTLSRKPVLYNRWVVLCIEIWGVIFWLIAFALCAESVAVYDGDSWSNGYGYDRSSWSESLKAKVMRNVLRNLSRRATNRYKRAVALTGVAAGLGALEL
jgi:hypothetical protein